MSDSVNHPAHYTEHPSGVECIQITEHMGFNLGNAVKYIWRADLKGSAIQDLEKARWYIDRELVKRGVATEPAEERRFKADEKTRQELGFHYPFDGAWSTPASAEPTETEWPTWQEVPNYVAYRSNIASGAMWMNMRGRRYTKMLARSSDSHWVDSDLDDGDMNTNLAPFVAVDGGAS